eukprot:COSAG02_NODE_6055_length_3838_cov_1.720246_5_plen_58_part_00
MLAATALGFPGEAGEDSKGQPARSPLPPRGAEESTGDRIARLEREIVRSLLPSVAPQ